MEVPGRMPWKSRGSSMGALKSNESSITSRGKTVEVPWEHYNPVEVSWEPHKSTTVPWWVYAKSPIGKSASPMGALQSHRNLVGFPWKPHGSPMRTPKSHCCPMGEKYKPHGVPWERYEPTKISWEPRESLWESLGILTVVPWENCGKPRRRGSPIQVPREAHGSTKAPWWEDDIVPRDSMRAPKSHWCPMGEGDKSHGSMVIWNPMGVTWKSHGTNRHKNRWHRGTNRWQCHES